MTVRFVNFGVEFDSLDQEKQMEDFIFDHGKYIEGYHGEPYVNYEFGSLQVILRTTVSNIEDGTKYLSVMGGDSHIRGNSVWRVRSLGVDATPEDADITEKRGCFCNAKTNEGFAVVNIVNADVIPSFGKDEIVEMQVVCFPFNIKYYDADKDDLQENDLKDLCKGLEDGELYSTGFKINHSRFTPEEIIEYEFDDVVEIRATVKEISNETTCICDMGKSEYIRCVVDTEFGSLDIVHTIDQVDQEHRNSIKEGSTVFIQGRISADVAIDDYEFGIVRDLENNLRVVKCVIEGGNAERLERVLAEDVVYVSDRSEETFEGRREVIDRLKYVQENGDPYVAFKAAIKDVDEGEALPYGVGDRCLVIRNEDNGDYESILFIDMNDNGEVTRIHTCTEMRYSFKIEEPPEQIDLFYRYDPDGIPMNLPYECIGMDKMFTFGAELMRYFDELNSPNGIKRGYSHEFGYEMKYVDDICFCISYRLDDERRVATHDITIPLGRNDRSIWDAMISMNPKGPGPEYYKSNVVLRRKTDGRGMAVLELVNGDICPSYIEDDEIKLRVTAFPEYINYYLDENDYVEDMHRDDQEKVNTLANGVVFPAFFLKNSDSENDDEQNYDRNNINYILGEVIEVMPGVVGVGARNDIKAHFIKCIVETEFGELEILHTEDMVPAERRGNIKPGSMVYGAFRLYGNPAVNGYSNGIIYDEENNLKKLREILLTGAAEGLIEMSVPDLEVYFDGKTTPGIVGIDEVIRYLKESHTTINTRPGVDMATLTEVNVDGNQTKIPGKRCLAFSEDAEGEFTSLWFVEVNDEGRISKITYSVSNGYKYRIDPKPKFEFGEMDFDDQQIH